MTDTETATPTSIEDGGARYVHTEYLQDFNHLLKSYLTELVRWEVENFKARKIQAYNIQGAPKTENNASAKRKADAFVSYAPPDLWASGRKIVGPRHLPRGETTSLYLVLSGGRTCWIVGYFQVYTDLDGKWELLGYVSSKGDVAAFSNEVIEPKPDGLAQITGRRAGGLLGQLGAAFDSYLSFSEQTAGQSTQRTGISGQSTPQYQQAKPVRSLDDSTFEERMKDRAGGAQTKREAPAPQVNVFDPDAGSSGSAYSPATVKTAIERVQPVPGWYSELSSSTLPAQRDLHRKFLEAAANYYPQILQRTSESKQIWRFLKRMAVDKGFAKEWCKAFDKEIEVNKEEGCKLFGRCEKGKPGAHSQFVCSRQFVRPGSIT